MGSLRSKAAIKRAQNHACMSYAEREQARNAVSNHTKIIQKIIQKSYDYGTGFKCNKGCCCKDEAGAGKYEV